MGGLLSTACWRPLLARVRFSFRGITLSEFFMQIGPVCI